MELPELNRLEGNPSTYEMQQYVKDLCQAQGWDKSNYQEIFLLFMEEIGELAKALRYQDNLYKENSQKKVFSIEEELADVFSYLLHLSNTMGINLSKAFLDKEIKNRSRKWESKSNSV